MQKIKTVKKIRFADYGELFPVPIIVPEAMLNHYLKEKDKEYLKDWSEVVLVDDIFYICISRPLQAVAYVEPKQTYKLL